MSRASWSPFEETLQHLLVSRDVVKADARAIASDVVDECGRFLIR